ARAAAWLIDASGLKTSIRTLVIAWDLHAGTEVVKVDVDASDDLKTWHRVATHAPLMHLEQADAKIEQPRVDLRGLHAKYLRIAGEPAAFSLKGVEAISDEIVKAAPRLTRTIEGLQGAKPGEYVFDLGARIPIESLNVVLATNTVAPFAIATRDDP